MFRGAVAWWAMTTRSLLPAAVLLIGCSLHRRPAVIEPARGPARDSLLMLDQARGDSVVARGRVAGALALIGQRRRVPARRHSGRVRARCGARAVRGDPAIAGSAPGRGSRWAAASRATCGPATPTASRRTPTRQAAAAASIATSRSGSARSAQPWRIVAYAEVERSARRGAAILRHAARAADARRRPRSAAETAGRLRAADSLFSDLADRMGTAFAFSNTVAPDGRPVRRPDARRRTEGRPGARGSGGERHVAHVAAGLRARRRVRRPRIHGRRVHRHRPQPVGRGGSEIWKVSHGVAAPARRRVEVRDAGDATPTR